MSRRMRSDLIRLVKHRLKGHRTKGAIQTTRSLRLDSPNPANDICDRRLVNDLPASVGAHSSCESWFISFPFLLYDEGVSGPTTLSLPEGSIYTQILLQSTHSNEDFCSW